MDTLSATTVVLALVLSGGLQSTHAVGKGSYLTKEQYDQVKVKLLIYEALYGNPIKTSFGINPKVDPKDRKLSHTT